MAGSLRILELTHNLPRFPGDFSGSFIDALCQALVQLGGEVTVLAPHDRAYLSGMTRAYSLHTFRYAWPASLQTVGYMRSMVGDLRLRPSSVLVTPALLAAGIKACTRLVRHQRPDVLHAHWLLPNGFIAAVTSRLTGVKLAISLPGSDLLVARSNPLARAFARFSLAQADLVTANSAELQQVAYGLGARREQFDLIIYGVDPSALQPDPASGSALRQELALSPSHFVVLAVGRLVPKKGFRYLVEAMPGLLATGVDAYLLLVGEGSERQALEQLAAGLRLGRRVRFIGSVPRGRIGAYYNAADVLCMPSVTEPEDGLNVCVVDAMACGRPIVATTVAGNPLVVREGVNGFLVPERRADLLASRLADIAADRDLAARFGAASRKMAEQEFSWRALAGRYLNHFRRLATASS